MRKFVLSAVALLVTVGLTLAAQVTLVKYDAEKKVLTVKDKEDKEVEYKITDKTVFKSGDKDVPFEAAAKVLGNPKAAGKLKLDVTNDKDVLTEVKLPERKKKDKN
jgi:hypothetical protein